MCFCTLLGVAARGRNNCGKGTKEIAEQSHRRRLILQIDNWLANIPKGHILLVMNLGGIELPVDIVVHSLAIPTVKTMTSNHLIFGASCLRYKQVLEQERCVVVVLEVAHGGSCVS